MRTPFGSMSRMSRALQGHVHTRLYAAQSAAAGHAGAPLKPQNIWCIGRNYAEHIKELDAKTPDKEPLVFLKAGSSMLPTGTTLPLPAFSNNVHHEVEFAVELGPDLKPSRGVVALDLTLRDLQGVAKANGYPWTLCKSFPAATPLGTPFALTDNIDFDDLELELLVNGKARQRDTTASMLFKLPTLLDYLLRHFPAVPGDLLLTGTPHGVSALVDGDQVAIALRKGRGGPLLSSGSWTAKKNPQ